MELHCPAESDVRDHDHDPRDETRDRREVGEPLEGHGTRVRDIEKRERADCNREEHGDVRDAAFAGDGEPLRSLAVERHGIKHARAGEAKSVTGGPGRGENGRVDEVIQYRDPGPLNANHEGAGRCIRVGAQELLVIVGDDDANNQGAKTIEYGKAPDETSRGFGNIAAWRDGFAGGEGDQLGRRDERKPRASESRPKRQESSEATSGDVRNERAWRVLPIFKIKGVVVRATAKK